MKKRNIALRNLAVLTLLVSCFIACDEDFANIDSDIINNENATHFSTGSQDFEVLAYTKVLDPVQSNNLPINYLGTYVDQNSNYGRTTAKFVSQIRPGSLNPDFGGNPEIDSVVISIPYFSTPTGVDVDGDTVYQLDSIFGAGVFDLSIYESNYFLRDIDPNAPDINDSQVYYANGSNGSSFIDEALLEGNLLYQESNFTPDSNIIDLEEEGEVVSRLAPALRIVFDEDEDIQFWQEKIIDMEGSTELSNINNFNNYFRGIYFKAEPTNPIGTMMLLNFLSTNANITIFYSRDPFTEGLDRVQTTYAFNFSGNRVNILSNDFTIQPGDDTNGDENLFLKGAQGSIAEIKLFNGENPDEDNSTDNIFETFKNEFVETDEDGNFVSSKRLVNEANLVIYVNQDLIEGQEPDRIYLYDAGNNTPLSDYFFDLANTTAPEFSRIGHLGRLQREGSEGDGLGIKYKMRITEHINSLLLRDSTNVKLGLAVSGNVNLESNVPQYDILNNVVPEEKIPVSAIITPRGTVLYGNNTSNEEKKLYLEIFFTEPNN